MAPKYHPTPVSGSHRKALTKALTHSRAMTSILARRAAETRAAGEAMIREADDLLCQSWNERMWADGEPVDPSPTVDQAINGGYPWLEIACSRCRTPRTVDLASLSHVPTTCVHDLAGRLRCEKCRKAGMPAQLERSSTVRLLDYLRWDGAAQLGTPRAKLSQACCRAISSSASSKGRRGNLDPDEWAILRR
jgi:hypothetical protein